MEESKYPGRNGAESEEILPVGGEDLRRESKRRRIHNSALSLDTVFSEDSDNDFHPYELENSYKLEKVMPERTFRPCPRFSFCTITSGGGLYVWGGRSSREDFKVVENAMWRWDFQEMRWEQITGPDTPESRTGATAVLHEGCIWIFGGYHSKYTNTMIKYDIKENIWIRETTYGPDPPRRWHYSVVKYKNSMWMFGGTMDRTHYNDFHEFNFESKTWRPIAHNKLEPPSSLLLLPNHKVLDAPKARRRHTAVVWKDAMWVIGGREEGNLPQDLIRYDFRTQSWSRCDTLSNDSGCQIPKCADHSTWIDERTGCLFIFGAKDNSIVRYHFDTNTMVPVSCRHWKKAGLFKVTTHHGDAVYNEGKLYIFGGQNRDKTISNDIYAFDLGTRSRYKQKMKHLLGNETLSDVTFIVEGHEVPAHRVVLYAQCEYFKALFSGNFQEAQSREKHRIPIENCSVKVLFAVLRFLYADELWIPKTVDQLLQMLTLVDMYQIQVLRDHCVHLLEKRVTEKNAMVLLKAAMKFGLESLKDQCCQFIVSHFRYYVEHKLLVAEDENHLLHTILQKVADKLDPVKESNMDMPSLIAKNMFRRNDPAVDAPVNY